MITQLYEIQTSDEAEKLIDLGIDHIGSVIVSEESWKITEIYETIRTVENSANSKSSLIPLYSNRDAVFKTIDYYKPDILHFCDSLANHHGIYNHCNKLIYLQEVVKESYPEIKIMRSIPLLQTGLSAKIAFLELSRLFEPVSDYFLTDTLLTENNSVTEKEQPVEGFIGITGKTCDWDMAETLVEESNIPVILAGGLSPENVAAGIIKVGPSGVDSCTLTNAVDENNRPIRFKKDYKLVKSFIVEARRAVNTDFSQTRI